MEVYRTLIPLGPGDVFVSVAGFHHIAGAGNLAVALGAGSAIVAFGWFTVSAWRELDGLGITHALMIPPMIEMLLAADALPLPGLRTLTYGGSPIRPQTLARTVDVLPDVRITNLFGQTEGSPLCALTSADHDAIRAGDTDLLATVGRPVPGLELRIDAPDGEGVGEVVVRGPHLFAGGPDGWHRTGDLGSVDDRGYVHLVGRTGDTISRGGEIVRPVQVEDVLRTHPGVADVAVAGVADERLGEEIGAWVVPADPAAPPAFDELAAYARERLAGFKIPRVWSTVRELPKNANGKVLRRVLRDSASSDELAPSTEGTR
ncbi:Acyl-CoA synthetase, long-chain fatty acid:CoA ligase (fragment) [Frankia canadensis]|uniref:Acyl-CoA synthetase, long-chain fatty acid:CoA ligase n=1 Tax=Frankia canadensis TaxID=1836972 RepID=A0A2I2KNC9_9ACTN